eukprot:4895-Heterococcus_DN1.PRE.1
MCTTQKGGSKGTAVVQHVLCYTTNASHGHLTSIQQVRVSHPAHGALLQDIVQCTAHHDTAAVNSSHASIYCTQDVFACIHQQYRAMLCRCITEFPEVPAVAHLL